MSSSNEKETLFCEDVYDETWKVVASHIVVLCVLAGSIVFMVQFFNKRNLFPIKERSPYVALFQCLVYLFLLVNLYAIEILTRIGWNDWDGRTNASQVPLMRKLSKTFHLAIRLNIYLIFTTR